MDAHDLMREIGRLEQDLAQKKARLASIQASCQHRWSEAKYDPIIIKGYSVAPRTPQNYDDIPFAQGYTVPDQVTKRWTRTCALCGKTESTTQADKHTQVTETPKW